MDTATTYQVFDVRDGVARRIAPTTGRGSEWTSLAAAIKVADRITTKFGQYGSTGKVVETSTGATVYPR